MDRRGFLKFAAGGTVGLVASPIIWNTLYDAAYWTQNWSLIPKLVKGENTLIPTISKLDPTGTGIRLRLVGNRPVRTLGDPDNAISKGALTALAATEAQLLFSPARLKQPLKRSSDGAYVAISWDEAETLLKEKTKEAMGSIALISGDPNGTINELFSSFLNAAKSADCYLMPNEEMAAQKAWAVAGGTGRLGYDLENSDYILSIGANMLESWGTVARNRRIFSATHMPDTEPSMKLAYAGPVANNTAAGADLWLPIKPGTELAFALGIANALIKKGAAASQQGAADFAALAAMYTPEKVTEVTGVPADRFLAVVDGLTKAKKPLVIAGSPLGQGGGAAPVMAAIALNMLLGRVGQEGNLTDLPFPTPVLEGATDFRRLLEKDLIAFTQGIAADSKKAPKMLFVYDANPLFALPKNAGVAETLKAVPFKVALAGFFDETAAVCDLVLPAAHGLERFDDVYTPYGSGEVSWGVVKPVCAPQYKSRPAGELMLALAEEMGFDLGVKDMPELLTKKGQSLGADFEAQMESGEVFVAKPESAFSVLVMPAAEIKAAAAKTLDAQVRLAPQAILGMGTATTGIPPFSTKIITDYQLKGTHSAAQMNSAMAASLGVSDGQLIKISNESGTISAVVSVFEGVMPGTVALCTGLGHTAFDQFSKNKGANIINLAAVTREAGTNLPVWCDCGVNVAKG